MTNAKIEVVQADRDAATECVEQGLSNPYPAAVLGGLHDDWHLVQAFARHRLAHTPPAADGVVERYLSHRFQWAAPGDQQEDAWLLRFCDKERGDCIWTGEDAEAEAWAAWNQWAPSYNCYLFRLARLSPPSAGEPVAWRNIGTCPMWQVAVVTDGENVAIAQKAEADCGGHYWSIEPEDCLEWEPTLWTPTPAEYRSPTSDDKAKPFCSTCGKDVVEITCLTCAKWWADHPLSSDDKALVERSLDAGLRRVARSNLRHYLNATQFKCEADRTAALNCVDVLEEEIDGLNDLIAVLRSYQAAADRRAALSRPDEPKE